LIGINIFIRKRIGQSYKLLSQNADISLPAEGPRALPGEPFPPYSFEVETANECCFREDRVGNNLRKAGSVLGKCSFSRIPGLEKFPDGIPPGISEMPVPGKFHFAGV